MNIKEDFAKVIGLCVFAIPISYFWFDGWSFMIPLLSFALAWLVAGIIFVIFSLWMKLSRKKR